jgi:hypothetical protein
MTELSLNIAHSEACGINEFKIIDRCSVLENLHKSLSENRGETGKTIDGANEILVCREQGKIFCVVCFDMMVKVFPVSVSGEKTKDAQRDNFRYTEIMFLGWRRVVIRTSEGVFDAVKNAFDKIVNETEN